MLWLALADKSLRPVYIYKQGRSISLVDHESNLDEIVHPSNEASVEGWVREYKLCRPNVKIKHYRFLLPGDKP